MGNKAHRPSGRTRIRTWLLRRARWVLLILLAMILVAGVGSYLAPRERSFASYEEMDRSFPLDKTPAPWYLSGHQAYVGDEAGSSYFLTNGRLYSIPAVTWSYQPRFPYSMLKIRRVSHQVYERTALPEGTLRQPKRNG